MIKKIQGSTEGTYLSPSLSRKVLDDSFSSLKPKQKKSQIKRQGVRGSVQVEESMCKEQKRMLFI